MSANEHPIKKVTAYVLSEWAMMLVEPGSQPETMFSQNEPFFRVSAYYQGVFDGDLTIICQEPFLNMLARNVLGADSEEVVSPEEQWDALRELANIISGNYLVEAYGVETIFDLPHFELQQTSFDGVSRYITQKMSKFNGEAAALYLADGEPLFASFDINASDYSNQTGDRR
ncbi:MAG: chemotaxis protein CheX [Deltaproteobacteria bacterium]|nr:chemotaxis protein CheX [Deltaproteobacteria bacterium]